MVASGHGKISTAVLDELLQMGPDLMLQDSDGWTALHWAWFVTARRVVDGGVWARDPHPTPHPSCVRLCAASTTVAML